MAAERWYAGDGGPEAPLAKSAPDSCWSCGFLVRLAGPLADTFGVCANGNANDDGKVVYLQPRLRRPLRGQAGPQAAADPGAGPRLRHADRRRVRLALGPQHGQIASYESRPRGVVASSSTRRTRRRVQLVAAEPPVHPQARSRTRRRRTRRPGRSRLPFLTAVRWKPARIRPPGASSDRRWASTSRSVSVAEVDEDVADDDDQVERLERRDRERVVGQHRHVGVRRPATARAARGRARSRRRRARVRSGRPRSGPCRSPRRGSVRREPRGRRPGGPRRRRRHRRPASRRSARRSRGCPHRPAPTGCGGRLTGACVELGARLAPHGGSTRARRGRARSRPGRSTATRCGRCPARAP